MDIEFYHAKIIIGARSNNMNTLSPTRHKRCKRLLFAIIIKIIVLAHIQTIDPFPKIQPYSNKHWENEEEDIQHEPSTALDWNIYKSIKNTKSRDLIETTQKIYWMNDNSLIGSQSGLFYGQFAHGLSYDGHSTIKPQKSNIFVEKNSVDSTERLINDASVQTFDKSYEWYSLSSLMSQGLNTYYTQEWNKNIKLNPWLNVPPFKLKPSLYEIKFQCTLHYLFKN